MILHTITPPWTASCGALTLTHSCPGPTAGSSSAKVKVMTFPSAASPSLFMLAISTVTWSPYWAIMAASSCKVDLHVLLCRCLDLLSTAWRHWAAMTSCESTQGLNLGSSWVNSLIITECCICRCLRAVYL